MRKLRIVLCVVLSLFTASVFANAGKVLQERLGKVSNFQATFTQTVVNAEGTTVQDGKGELWVKRPNLFRWHMTSPDESLLVADGETLWFYNPFVEQASAVWMENVTDNTPFMLIARNVSNDWDKYDVTQKGDVFTLRPKNDSGNMARFDITVSSAGVIKGFSAIEQDGQKSTYALSGQKSGAGDDRLFKFTPPAGVTVDDQRR